MLTAQPYRFLGKDGDCHLPVGRWISAGSRRARRRQSRMGERGLMAQPYRFSGKTAYLGAGNRFRSSASTFLATLLMHRLHPASALPSTWLQEATLDVVGHTVSVPWCMLPLFARVHSLLACRYLYMLMNRRRWLGGRVSNALGARTPKRCVDGERSHAA